MRKGEQTRATILEAALALSGREGLEGLTIGALATRTGMSKSGVFAHFGSREELQIAVLGEYERRFIEEVLVPALAAPRGLARLNAIVERWLDRTAADAADACLWISGATEYDDRPGTVRDELVSTIRRWQKELSRAIRLAVDTGELVSDLDVDEFVFQLYGIVLILHHDGRLLDSPDALQRARRSFARLTSSYLAGPAPVSGAASAPGSTAPPAPAPAPTSASTAAPTSAPSDSQ